MRALIFDLDGTLVDTVYAHVFAWQRALAEAAMPIDGWRIHRRIGMSGGLFTRAVARELGRPLAAEEVGRRFKLATASSSPSCFPSGGRCPEPSSCSPSCERPASRTGSRHPVGGPRSTPRSTRSGSAPRRSSSSAVTSLRAKPEPDLFLACSERLGVPPEECYVVGDAVWDLLAARRARMLSVGLLSGGYGDDELTRAGAFRVYRDAEELRHSLDELGLLP